MRKFALMSVAAAIALVLDQITKLWVSGSMKVNDTIPIIEGVARLRYTHNRGAAFGLFQDATGMLTVLSLVVLAGILVVFVRIGNPSRLTTLASGLIVGGAIGNLLDRVRLGYVVDFFEVYGPHLDINHTIYTFPVFNVADSAITVGAILILAGLIFTKDPHPKPSETAREGGLR